MVRFFARILALLAIAAVAVGVYVIVHDNVRSTTSSRTHNHRKHHRQRHRAHAQHHHSSSKPSFYIVKSGDTLSAIIAKTHISLATITKLNPSLTPPYSLSTGQKLRLHR